MTNKDEYIASLEARVESLLVEVQTSDSNRKWATKIHMDNAEQAIRRQRELEFEIKQLEDALGLKQGKECAL